MTISYEFSYCFWHQGTNVMKLFMTISYEFSYYFGTRGQCYKTFYSCKLRIFTISSCVPLASLSRIVKCLWTRQGAYLRVEPTLPTYTILSWKGFREMNKARKKFYNIGPWCQSKKIIISSFLTVRNNKLYCHWVL